MVLTVACNNKKAEPVDTMPMDTIDTIEDVAVEDEIDSTIAAVTPAATPTAKAEDNTNAPVAAKANADGTKTVATGKVARKTAAKEPETPVAAETQDDGTKVVATGKVARKTAKQ